MQASALHVIGVYSNPRRWLQREALLVQWLNRVRESGAHVHVVEHAFGDRAHVLDPRHYPDVTLHQLRGGPEHEIWLKEALAEYARGHLPPTAEYVCWQDTDVQHMHPSWASETVDCLQHHRVCQTWSHSIDLGPQHQILPNEWGNWADRSFAQAWIDGDIEVPNGLEDYGPPRDFLVNKGKRDWRQHYGYSWAARADVLQRIGGLIKWLVTGSADYHMALAFAGKLHMMLEKELADGRGMLNEAYVSKLRDFGAQCDRVIQQDIGCVPGALAHFWHGAKRNRGYISRKDILIQSNFNPDRDIAYDHHGLPYISSDNRLLRDGLRRYFRERNEDSIDV